MSRLFALMLSSTLLGLVQPARADCPGTLAGLAADQGMAFGAWASVNRETLDDAVAQATGTFDCLGEVLDGETAAGWLRLQGMEAFRQDDEARARLLFLGATAAFPDYHFPESMIPAGNSLYQLFEDAHAAKKTDEAIPMDLARGVKAAINGDEAAARPIDRPAVYQFSVWPAGLVWSGVLMPGEPVPWAQMPTLKPALQEQRRRLRIARGLGIGTAVSGVSAVAMEVTARMALEGRVDLPAAQAANLHGGAVGAGGLAIGFGSAFVAVRW